MRSFLRREDREENVPATESGDEQVTDRPGRERPRVYFPSPDIGSSIRQFIDTLFEDLDDYSYRAAEGDVAVADRLETMLVLRANFVVGLLRPLRPDVATTLFQQIRATSRRYDGTEFASRAMVHIGSAVGATMFGRAYPGASIDKGEGLEAIYGGGDAGSGGSLES